MPEAKILVSAFPRSGTHYMNDVLNACGVKTGHEADGPDGTVTCFYAVDDYYYPGQHKLRPRDLFFEYRLHQVRNPLQVIGSFRSLKKKFVFSWFEKHTGIGLDDGTKTEVVAQLWLKWNLTIANQRVDLRYRIEDLPAVWPRIQKMLDIEQDIPAHVGTTGERFEPATWEELGEWATPVRAMAERYGYKFDTKEGD